MLDTYVLIWHPSIQLLSTTRQWGTLYVPAARVWPPIRTTITVLPCLMYVCLCIYVINVGARSSRISCICGFIVYAGYLLDAGGTYVRIEDVVPLLEHPSDWYGATFNSSRGIGSAIGWRHIIYNSKTTAFTHRQYQGFSLLCWSFGQPGTKAAHSNVSCISQTLIDGIVTSNFTSTFTSTFTHSLGRLGLKINMCVNFLYIYL